MTDDTKKAIMFASAGLFGVVVLMFLMRSSPAPVVVAQTQQPLGSVTGLDFPPQSGVPNTYNIAPYNPPPNGRGVQSVIEAPANGCCTPHCGPMTAPQVSIPQFVNWI